MTPEPNSYRFRALSNPRLLRLMTVQIGERVTLTEQYKRFDAITRPPREERLGNRNSAERAKQQTNNEHIPF